MPYKGRKKYRLNKMTGKLERKRNKIIKSSRWERRREHNSTKRYRRYNAANRISSEALYMSNLSLNLKF